MCDVLDYNLPQKKHRAPMRQYNVDSLFERIALDVSGLSPESCVENKYILVVMNYFTKCVETHAIINEEAKTVANVLIKVFISRFGLPLEFHSDRGRNFENHSVQRYIRSLMERWSE